MKNYYKNTNNKEQLWNSFHYLVMPYVNIPAIVYSLDIDLCTLSEAIALPANNVLGVVYNAITQSLVFS